MAIQKIKKKNGDIVYRQNVYLGIDKTTGDKVRTTITARTKSELKRKIILKKNDFLENGRKHKKHSYEVFNDLIDVWLKQYEPTIKKTTYRASCYSINKYIRPKFGKFKIEKLDRKTLQKQFLKWADEYNNGKNVSRSLSLIKSILVRIFDLAIHLDFIENNPARDVIIPKLKKVDSKKIRFLETTEIDKFIKYLNSLNPFDFKLCLDRNLYKLAIASGCRIGELLALEWSDIDFTKNTISISKTLTNKNEITKPKTENSNRIVFIDKSTMKELKRFKSQQSNFFRKACKFVFCNKGEKPQTYHAALYRLDRHIELSGMNYFSFHAFRHTHASILLNSGVPYKEIQSRLGHSKIETTMNTYSHLFEKNEKDVANVFENSINGFEW